MIIFNLLACLLPSFIQVPIRRLLGAKIGKGSKISFGTILLSKEIDIGSNVKIGIFTIIKSQKFKAEDNCVVKSFSILNNREISLGKYVHVAPFVIVMGDNKKESIFKVGDHSRFFPFCWIEPGEGISIGKNVGIGGHTLIFTHGVWPDYLNGGPVSYGPVTIHDNVWLPWRVFIMPRVEIGKNSIIGANSLVNRNVPENVVAAGSPAKIVNQVAIENLTPEEKNKRALEVLSSFSDFLNYKLDVKTTIQNGILTFDNKKIILNDINLAQAGDIVFNVVPNSFNFESISKMKFSFIDQPSMTAYLVNKCDDESLEKDFIAYLRRYGVRLYIEYFVN